MGIIVPAKSGLQVIRKRQDAVWDDAANFAGPSVDKFSVGTVVTRNYGGASTLQVPLPANCEAGDLLILVVHTFTSSFPGAPTNWSGWTNSPNSYSPGVGFMQTKYNPALHTSGPIISVPNYAATAYIVRVSGSWTLASSIINTYSNTYTSGVALTSGATPSAGKSILSILSFGNNATSTTFTEGLGAATNLVSRASGPLGGGGTGQVTPGAVVSVIPRRTTQYNHSLVPNATGGGADGGYALYDLEISRADYGITPGYTGTPGAWHYVSRAPFDAWGVEFQAWPVRTPDGTTPITGKYWNFDLGIGEVGSEVVGAHLGVIQGPEVGTRDDWSTRYLPLEVKSGQRLVVRAWETTPLGQVNSSTITNPTTIPVKATLVGA